MQTFFKRAIITSMMTCELFLCLIQSIRAKDNFFLWMGKGQCLQPNLTLIVSLSLLFFIPLLCVPRKLSTGEHWLHYNKTNQLIITWLRLSRRSILWTKGCTVTIHIGIFLWFSYVSRAIQRRPKQLMTYLRLRLHRRSRKCLEHPFYDKM